VYEQPRISSPDAIVTACTDHRLASYEGVHETRAQRRRELCTGSDLERFQIPVIPTSGPEITTTVR
jgi:hypothetical protein